MRAMRLVTLVLIGAVATFGLGACGGGDDEDTVSQGDLRAVDEGGEPRFEPEEFTIRLNSETSFDFENEDDNRQHNFTLTAVFVDADNFVSVDVPSGQSREVKFTARERPRDGFFSFYCRFHQAEGMQGKITVR